MNVYFFHIFHAWWQAYINAKNIMQYPAYFLTPVASLYFGIIWSFKAYPLVENINNIMAKNIINTQCFFKARIIRIRLTIN